MAEPTARDREQVVKVLDEWEMQWRHIDHVFELPDVVTDDLLARFAPALAAARAEGPLGQPIETAPADGTDVLVFYEGNKQWLRGRWVGLDWQIEGYPHIGHQHYLFTAWMPLPPPPTGAGK